MPVPNNLKQQALDAYLSGETLKVALYTDETSYTFSPEDTYVSDILDGGTTAWEFGANSGSGYSRQTLSNVQITQDDADDEGVFDADDTTFAGISGATIQGVIIYRQVGGDDTTPGDDELVAVIDDVDSGDLPIPTNGGDVTFTWNSEGIINIT